MAVHHRGRIAHAPGPRWGGADHGALDVPGERNLASTRRLRVPSRLPHLAPGEVDVLRPQGLGHLLQGQPEGPQAGRVDLHLHLALLPPEDGHLPHPALGLQAVTDALVGQAVELLGCAPRPGPGS